MGTYSMVILIILALVFLVAGFSLSLTARQGDDLMLKALDESDSQEKTDEGLLRREDLI